MHKNDITELDTWFGQGSVYKKKDGHWANYMQESTDGERVAVVAEFAGAVVGFCTLKFNSRYQNFVQQNIPEISDMIVAPPFRQRGIARALVTHLEGVARQQGFTHIGIGVGLYADYGPAQRLYVNMGYVPDGKGVTYNYETITPAQAYPVDDDLVLWFTKAV